MDTDHLLTLDEGTLAVPESRVKNAGGIRSRIAEMKQADKIRSERRQRIQGLIDGNRPWNQQKLINTGQGDRTNLNLRQGKGMANAAKTPYYSLIFRVARFASIVCQYGDQQIRNDAWSEIVSDEFHDMLDEWDGFDYGMQFKQFEMVVHGVGMAVWDDEDNPFWEPCRTGDLLVPDGVRSNIDKLPEAVRFRRMNPVDLWKLVEKEDSAKSRGWFVERVKKAIAKRATVEMRDKWGLGWGEEYQASLRRGDVLWNNRVMEIPLAHYLIKEFSGKITQVIMLDDGDVAQSQSTSTPAILSEEDEGMLFKRVGRFECFGQVICPFFFDVGVDGEWHSVKALGPEIFDFCEVKNRTFSMMLDGMKAGASILLQAKDGTAELNTQLTYINGGTVIPPDFEVVQNRVAAGLDGPVNVMHEMDNVLQNNTGQFMQRTTGENSEPTLGQAQLNYQTQGQLGDAARDRYLKTLDRLYREMVRRTLLLGAKLYKRKPDRLNPHEKLVSDFFNRCIARGVPAEALDFKNIIKVKATRGFGNGSPVSREISIQRGMTMLPVLNERGRNIVKREALAFYFGQNMANEIEPPLGRGDIPDSDEWAANVENNDMRDPFAEEPILTAEQDDAIHFGVHFQGSMRAVQMLKEGIIEPQIGLFILHNFGPHMRKHLDRIKGDPTRAQQLGSMEEAWQTLTKIADKLQQEVQEAAKAEEGKAQQPQINPDDLAKLMKVHGDLQLKASKEENDSARKDRKLMADLRRKDIQAANSIRLEREKATQTEPVLASAA